MVAGALKLTGGTFLQTIAQGLYTSRTINFVTDFPNDLDYKLVGKIQNLQTKCLENIQN